MLLTAVLAGALLPAGPASAASITVDRSFFGVHDLEPTTGPAAPAGSIRLWDSKVTWSDLQPDQDRWEWARLDEIVNDAQARGVEVTLVLGQTPEWADDPALEGVGAAYMPRLDAWNNYVATVADRYRGRIKAYQVWNEANIVNYWAQNQDNSPTRMGQLTSAAYGVVKSIDPGALVIGPAFATRLGWQRRYLGFFYGQRVNGVPIWKRMDAISLNLYPLAAGTPEGSMKLLAAARVSMAFRGVPTSKPLWNTEINYGLATGGSGSSTLLTSERQAAYVLRTYLLNAAQGVKRVHWYVWDRPAIGSTKMVGEDGTTLTLAGKAFGLAQSWMLGGTLVGATKSSRPCTRNSLGIYTCVIKYSGGVKRVYWHPSKSVKMTAVRNATFKVGVYGKRTAIKGGATIKVDYRPLMVRSKS
ncbi:MAG: endo-1,4-beta-xylanase [Chloroflexi bacterium]|nr:endo-1,4-beta-xylanase [Chloroflexota bacterium]